MAHPSRCSQRFQWMVTARIVRGADAVVARNVGSCTPRGSWVCQAGASSSGNPSEHGVAAHHPDATINAISSSSSAEVGLSFFGFGVQPPDVSLGTLIGDHAGAALTFPWEFYFPAGFLIVLVLAINLVGDGLRDAFDPQTQGR